MTIHLYVDEDAMDQDLVRSFYYPNTDSLYIDRAFRTSTESQGVSVGVVLDYDADGNLVGIDIDNAGKKQS